MEKQFFKIGDKVFDILCGWGVVTSVGSDKDCAVKVSFESETEDYTAEGFYNTSHKVPLLSHEEYTFSKPFKKRMVEVRDEEDEEWLLRYMIAEHNGRPICFNVDKEEHVKEDTYIYHWNHWREVEPKKFTRQQIADKLGIRLEDLEIID